MSSRLALQVTFDICVDIINSEFGDKYYCSNAEVSKNKLSPS